MEYLVGTIVALLGGLLFYRNKAKDSDVEARLANTKGQDQVLKIREEEIEKAIMIANLGFNPMNNGDVIIINVPALTEERRRDLAKQAKAEAENAKVGIRNARKEANNDIKKTDVSDDMKKDSEANVQTLTDSFVKEIDEKFSIKEKEIMTV